MFFECAFSTRIWENLMRGVLRRDFTVCWDDLVKLCTKAGMQKVQSFIIRYAMQLTVYSIWRERNRRRHGEPAMPFELLTKVIEKNMRNRLTTIKSKGDSDFEGGLMYWFSTR